MKTVSDIFTRADDLVSDAIMELACIRRLYERSPLPTVTKKARVEAINAKIDYLSGCQLNGNAHPWVEDDL